MIHNYTVAVAETQKNYTIQYDTITVDTKDTNAVTTKKKIFMTVVDTEPTPGRVLVESTAATPLGAEHTTKWHRPTAGVP